MSKRTGRRWRERIVPAVLKRDNGICHLCDKPGADTADHIIPWSQWPEHDKAKADMLGNLKAAHDRCNKIRGARSIEWARNQIAKHNGDTTAHTSGWDW